MVLNTEQVGVVKIISLTGKLNLEACPIFEATIGQISPGERVLFDFAKLDYIASAGLRLVLQAAKSINKTNGKLVVCSLTPNVMQIFKLTGFTNFLNLERDRGAALRKLEA